ncbi:class I SAM-dependent DNA methyltransferase [Rossellomorea vietnamensis]|uniref:class I SAM-dependent DNA methyltransferase n=1 Tax=Rossellomorea vietnamensis TaxID=218284 RepID=UPI001E653648|nr:class I SAM-dependent methyltransferase [Rossellomorea vietnamensis]MCC5801476.1 class I SAM-dependent methyltransferase [Rossellomorea vietnamensis]
MGREFLDLFGDWADSYDDTVTGKDVEYQAVFEHYDSILDGVVARSEGKVVEFGPGTGNLTKKLLDAGLEVIPYEPSPEMRAIGMQKLGDRVTFRDGDFLDFSLVGKADSIVSSYAFHHLTDEEKGKAFGIYGKLLVQGGKIVFADTMFETDQHHQAAISQAIKKEYVNLAEDLKREYYTTLEVLRELLRENGFSVQFQQVNTFVWIMEATKQ